MIYTKNCLFNAYKYSSLYSVLNTNFTRHTSQFANQMEIKTFIFFDSETTGLPFQEYNRTRITELCLLAVESNHIKAGVFPRIQNKLNLCFNPCKPIHPQASKITGMSNKLLEFQSEFNESTFGLIRDFVALQQQPVCLVAHNGNRFDYPILRAEIHKTGNELVGSILCIDTLIAFKELQSDDQERPEHLEGVPIELQDGFDELLCSIVDEVEDLQKKKLTVQQIQAINETTPPKIHIVKGRNGTGVRRNLNFGKVSFKLGDVYQRLTTKLPSNAHRADFDVEMLVECAVVLGERFVDWANFNSKRFCDIPIMQPGKPIGT